MFLNGLKVWGSEFLQRKFVKRVTILQIGTVSATFIQGVTGIILARLLQPELFGIYTLAFSLAALAAILLSAGIGNAATNLLGAAYARRDEGEVADIFGFLLKITFYAIILTLVISFLLPEISNVFYKNSSVGFYAGIVCLAVMLSSLSYTFVMIALQLLDRIKDMTKFMILDPSIRWGISILFIFLGWGVLGVAIGQVVGAVIIFIYASFVWKRVVTNQDGMFPNLKKILAHSKSVKFKKYFGFTFWVALDRNMGNLYVTLPVVITGLYVAIADVTFFKLAFGYINLVMGLLVPISVLSNVEFPKIKVEDPTYLRHRFKTISIYSLGFSIVLTLASVVIAPYFVKYLYGASFLPMVQYIYGLTIFGALYGIGVGLGSMWRALNMVKTSILINTIILAVGIPLGMYMIKTWSLWGAVVMVTLWFTTSHLVSFFYLIKKLNSSSSL